MYLRKTEETVSHCHSCKNKGLKLYYVLVETLTQAKVVKHS